MASHMKNPAAGVAGRARECRKRAAFDGPEHNPFTPIGAIANRVVIDLAAQRAAWLIRRNGVSPSMALAVAELAFGEGRA